jgi:hypothetical protein
MPLGAVVPFQREGLGSFPDLDLLDEPGAERGEGISKSSGGVGPLKTVNAEIDAIIDSSTNIYTDRFLTGVDPALDLDTFDCEVPASWAVDMVLGGVGHGH